MKKLTLLLLFTFTSLVYAQPNINQPDDITVFESPFDGFADFDLTINESQLLNGIDPATVSILYYLTLADAQNQTNPIAVPTNFSNFTNPQTIYVSVTEISTNLFSTTSFDIEVSDDFVNIPDANFLQSIIQQGVDTNNSGNIQLFEALAVSSLHIDELVTNTIGLEAFTNLTELTSSIPVYAFFDLSQLPLLEKLDVFTAFGSSADVDLSGNPNLKTLLLSNTFITTLDVSNNVLLEELSIYASGLTTLGLNNNPNLQSLSITFNQQLETVFIKNGSDESTNIDSGSWSENWAFGNNPSLQYVCADPSQVAEIQGFSQGSYVVNSFCDFQPGGNFNTITGVTQFDVNNDGCDASDPVAPFLSIEVGNGPATLVPAVTSDSVGIYNLYVGQAGDYTVQPFLENPSYFNINPNLPSINIPTVNNSSTTQDFCLTTNTTLADAEVVIAPIFPSRPGFDATYKLVYKNKGNQILSGNVDFEYNDTVLDFVSSSTTPYTQTAGLLTYTFTNLVPFESRVVEITLNVNGPTETPPINIDDILFYSGTISIDQTEETPNDNSFDYAETVVGAYDPNDITCLQGDVAPETLIGEFLHYLIRFENTGNAPAENVIVTTDINPADYSINTLQILNASHDKFIRNNSGVIEFVFENIQLAGGGGHGNILLKIETQPNLTISDEVEAQANIYFDYNFPIETNDANTTFVSLSNTGFQTDESVRIYPNPVKNILSIKANNAITSIALFDMQGRLLQTQTNTNNQLELDLSLRPSGIYFVKITTEEGVNVEKILKD